MRASNCIKKLGLLAASSLTGLILGASALAQTPGMPTDGAMGFQEPATVGAQKILWLNSIVMPLIIGIAVFVLILMIYIFIRFNAKANPEPSKNSHNTLLEVVWTAAPVAIVFGLIVLATEPLYYLDEVPETDITIKAVGNQWNWDYVYVDHGEFEFNSGLLPEEDANAAGVSYRLATTEPMVVPVGKKVRLIVTASDVLHSWTIPSFGVKMDAIPGRLNETWFEVTEPGTYYGQCSEICGREHAFMPIEVKVVPQAEFDAWVLQKNPSYVKATPTLEASNTPQN